ncbi:SsrA-binding protein [Candidatus Shikimatogenerans bostrichidophilus]|uniref:SsrA-binding protein n=1 Tax=Candidatus Shikimatogenerans bostrichidophilus TaxID=2943807 RepID=UPI002966C352
MNIINKKAYYEYYLIEKYNAGMVLTGKQIKLIRNNNFELYKSYCKIYNNEIYIINFKQKLNNKNKKIKLLLTKREINRIKQKLKNNNFTIIPTKIFFSNNGYAKLEIYLSKKKKIYDKRLIIKKREKLEKDNINKYYNNNFN